MVKSKNDIAFEILVLVIITLVGLACKALDIRRRIIFGIAVLLSQLESVLKAH